MPGSGRGVDVEFGDEALLEAMLVRCRAERLSHPDASDASSGAGPLGVEARICQRTVRLDQ